MKKRSKRYKSLFEKSKMKKISGLDSIISEIKSNPSVKFVESIDLSLKINLKKIKGADTSLRTAIELPNGNGKKIRVGIVCDDNKLSEPKFVGG